MLSLVGLLALVGTAAVGVLVHELSHATALYLAGVPCRIEVLPGRGSSGRFRVGVGGPLARVTPTRLPEDQPPWTLRAAALMPLVLAAPFVLVVAGVLANPFAAGEGPLALAAIAWLACAIPSPGDFSLVWYPERAIASEE